MADIQNNVEGSGNSSTMTWVVVFLVLVILGIVGYFMFYRPANVTPSTSTNTESTTYSVTVPPTGSGTGTSSASKTINTNTSVGY